MKTTVQALKELYAKLGGDLADVALIDRVPDMIEALNSIAVAVPAPTAEDKGKVITVGDDGALDFANALPPVTAEDAGKVMTVDEQGVWNPAETSGGGMDIECSIVISGTEVNDDVYITKWSNETAIPSDFETGKTHYAVLDGVYTSSFSGFTGPIVAFETNEYGTILFAGKLSAPVNANGFSGIVVFQGLSLAYNKSTRKWRIYGLTSAEKISYDA